MTGSSPFQPRILVVLATTLIVLFAASLLMTGTDSTRQTGDLTGSNTYSHSAIGYLGFFDMLQKLDQRAIRGQQAVLAKLGDDGVLILAEPNNGLPRNDGSNVLGARTTLIVLPKWEAQRSTEREDWIATAKLANVSRAQSILYAVAGAGDIARVSAPSAYQKSIPIPDPTLNGTVQLINGSKLRPLVATSDGILLGEMLQGNRRFWLLSDPDVIENHGIGKGDNAVFAKAMIEGLLAGRKGVIVFDETIHGFQSAPPSPLKFLFEFPFNLIALQALAGVALLLWAAMGRFGIPQMRPRPLEAGKRELITNAASLIDYAGHHAAILKRYASIALQDTGRLLRAPRQASDAELIGWLEKTAKARGVQVDIHDVLQPDRDQKRPDLASMLARARAIHNWKKEMIDGTSGRLGGH